MQHILTLIWNAICFTMLEKLLVCQMKISVSYKLSSHCQHQINMLCINIRNHITMLQLNISMNK